MLERLTSDVFGDHGKRSYEIAKGILDLASSKAGEDKFLFLSVHEGGNPRNSFDINVYRAGLHMKEIHSFLLDIGRFYSIPGERFHDLYDTIETQILGHIAGGIDRSGNDFLTLYFGE